MSKFCKLWLTSWLIGMSIVAFAGLETGTYISDLVTTNPTGTDNYSTADDHLRLIKATVKNTFPNINNAVTLTDEVLNSGIALLAGSNTFTVGPQILSYNAPQWVYIEADAATNNKRWDTIANGEKWCIRAVNDADSVAGEALCIDRTTTTIDLLTVGGPLTTGSQVTSTYAESTGPTTASVYLNSNSPAVGFREADASADRKLWDILINVGQLSMRTCTDSSSCGNFLEVTHNGTVASVVNLVGTAVRANGSGVWTAANDGIGSGLDADLLDGITSTSFARTDQQTVFTGTAPRIQVADGGGPAGTCMIQLADDTCFSDEDTVNTLGLRSMSNNTIGFLSFGSGGAGATIGWNGVQFQLNGVDMRSASIINTGTFTDARIAQSNVTQHMGAGYARNISGRPGVTKTISSGAPSGGGDGDIWYRY